MTKTLNLYYPDGSPIIPDMTKPSFYRDFLPQRFKFPFPQATLMENFMSDLPEIGIQPNFYFDAREITGLAAGATLLTAPTTIPSQGRLEPSSNYGGEVRYIQNGINGHPVVRLDCSGSDSESATLSYAQGEEDYSRLPSSLSASVKTFFYVLRDTRTSTSPSMSVDFENYDSWSTGGVAYFNIYGEEPFVDVQNYLQFMTEGYDIYFDMQGVDPLAGSTTLYCIEVFPWEVSYYINGVEGSLDTGVSSPTNIEDYPANNVILDAFYINVSGGSVRDVAAIVAYDGQLPTEQRQTIERHLMNVWGIE